MNTEVNKVRPSTVWKQKKSDAFAAALGRRFCMSCRTMKPTETVKRYRGVKRNVVLRCDLCQALRVECLRERKDARREEL